MTMRLVLGMVLALVGSAAAAQPAAGTADAPDPARLAVAREVVDLAYPPATRRAMFAGVEAAMLPMMQQALQTPELKQQFAADPRLQPIFDRYLMKIEAQVTTDFDRSLPTLFTAYARAYARRFTLAQLGDLKAFFATPTGQVYTSRALSLLSDPDVAAANQTLMIGAMQGLRPISLAMVAEIKALPPRKPGS